MGLRQEPRSAVPRARGVLPVGVGTRGENGGGGVLKRGEGGGGVLPRGRWGSWEIVRVRWVRREDGV